MKELSNPMYCMKNLKFFSDPTFCSTNPINIGGEEESKVYFQHSVFQKLRSSRAVGFSPLCLVCLSLVSGG